MNKNIVQIIISLFEDSKFFLHEAQKRPMQDEVSERYIKASIFLSWAAFEGWINKTSLDFAKNLKELSAHEKAFLLEKRVVLDKGQFMISNSDKYESSESKLEFLLTSIAKYTLDKSTKHWQEFLEAKNLRDSLVHPKENRFTDYTVQKAENTIKALCYYLDILSKKIYHKRFTL